MVYNGLIWVEWGEKFYKQQATGERAMFGYMKRMRVSCTECGITMSSLYLKHHIGKLHGICVPQTRGVNNVGVLPTTYVVSFPRVIQSVRCSVPGYLAVAHSVGRLRENLVYQHSWFKVAVV